MLGCEGRAAPLGESQGEPGNNCPAPSYLQHVVLCWRLCGSDRGMSITLGKIQSSGQVTNFPDLLPHL